MIRARATEGVQRRGVWFRVLVLLLLPRPPPPHRRHGHNISIVMLYSALTNAVPMDMLVPASMWSLYVDTCSQPASQGCDAGTNAA